MERVKRLPSTQGRVPHLAYGRHNERITDHSIDRVRRMADVSSVEVTRHLGMLAKEWGMERTLMLNASIAAGTGILLSLLGSSKWLIFSGLVLAFLAQHAIQGYCPPMLWFRAYGWRTAFEIEEEMTALRLLHSRGPPSLADVDKKALLDEMIRSKRSEGAFLGEGPSKAADRAAAEE